MFPFSYKRIFNFGYDIYDFASWTFILRNSILKKRFFQNKKVERGLFMWRTTQVKDFICWQTILTSCFIFSNVCIQFYFFILFFYLILSSFFFILISSLEFFSLENFSILSFLAFQYSGNKVIKSILSF